MTCNVGKILRHSRKIGAWTIWAQAIGICVVAVHLLGLSFVGTVYAQTTSVQTPDKNEASRTLILEQILLDRMIIPGKGLNSVTLGATFEAVTRSLGAPAKETESGLLSKTKHWHYALDNATSLVISGANAVESLNVIGNYGSSYITSEGVTFGMQPNHVAGVYGFIQPEKDILAYQKIGISFRFDAQQLAEILVTDPK